MSGSAAVDANAGLPGRLKQAAQTYMPALREETPREPHERAHSHQGPTPLTAAEIQAHPEYPHAYWDLKPDQRGELEVAAGRGGPFKLAYEVHGHGPSKILVSRRLHFRPAR